MKTTSVLPVLACFLTTICAPSVAVTGPEYVIVNLNSVVPGNNLKVYKLDTSTGAMMQIAALKTGGQGLLSSYPGNTEQAISQGASCIFAMDAGVTGGVTDIAAFSKASGFAKVGNYSNPALDASLNGGSLALSPNGRFLYGSYSFTGNIGFWTVNPDCSLTFVASYVPSGNTGLGALNTIKATPNGAALIVNVPSPISGAELFAINQSTGALTDTGFLSMNSLCSQCSLYGLDITKDSKFVVFAANEFDDSSLVAGAVSAQITTRGLVNPRFWNLNGNGQLAISLIPFFSAPAYAGSGSLYFGMQGNGGDSGGVITAAFNEAPLSIAIQNSTRIDNAHSNGTIAVTGTVLVVAEVPNMIGVFSINSDGSLTRLSQTNVSKYAQDMFSLSLFPNTR